MGEVRVDSDTEAVASLSCLTCSVNSGVYCQSKISFGSSLGDFIVVVGLAKKIRKDCVDAPTQFHNISQE